MSTAIAVPILTARAQRINAAHRKSVEAGKSMLEYAIEAGRELLEVKKAAPHGSFMLWCGLNLHFSHKQANRYMAVAKSSRATNIDLGVTLDAALEAAGQAQRGAPADPCKLTPDDASRILNLARMSNGGNEHEEVVAQEMLDRMAKRFGMTGEEAQAEALKLCPEPPSHDEMVAKSAEMEDRINRRLAEIEAEVRAMIEAEGLEGAIKGLSEVIYGLMYKKGSKHV